MAVKTNVIEKFINDKDFDTLNVLKRWNGKRTHYDESVGHHIFLHATFTRILAECLLPGNDDDSEKLELVTGSLLHEDDEWFNFDISHEVKYNPYNGVKIRKLLDDYTAIKIKEKFKEDDSISKMFKKYALSGDISESHKSIWKIADWCSCIFYLNKEIYMGNRKMKPYYVRCVDRLHLVCKEFLEKYKDVYETDIIEQLIVCKFLIS